jgi:hypothetical protein
VGQRRRLDVSPPSSSSTCSSSTARPSPTSRSGEPRLGVGVGALARCSPLRTERARLSMAHHIAQASPVAAVGLLAVQLLDLLAVPARPGQPPPPSGDPGPQAAPDHDDCEGHAQPARPTPPTSTPRPPATPSHDHHVLPLHRPRVASIARRQEAAHTLRCRRPRRVRGPGKPGPPRPHRRTGIPVPARVLRRRQARAARQRAGHAGGAAHPLHPPAG